MKSVQTQPVFGKTKQVHFVGIGGIGMSVMAEILLKRGYTMTVSDGAESENTERLRSLGAAVYTGHNAKNCEGA